MRNQIPIEHGRADSTSRLTQKMGSCAPVCHGSLCLPIRQITQFGSCLRIERFVSGKTSPSAPIHTARGTVNCTHRRSQINGKPSHYCAYSIVWSMIRALSWIVVAVTVAALAVSRTDAVYETSISCTGISHFIEYPIGGKRAPTSAWNQVSGPNSAIVLRGVNLGADVYIEDCNNVGGGKTMVMNVSDPSTWLVVMPGISTCYYTLDDDDQSSPGCTPVNGSLLVSHISEHCGNVATAEICNPLETSAASLSVTVSVVVAVGVLVANLVIA